jgi:dihydroflavonol-4-reductase
MIDNSLTDVNNDLFRLREEAIVPIKTQRTSWARKKKMMTEAPITFLTGGTGFVGSAVARVLLTKGHKIRALVRPKSDRSNLIGLDNIDFIEGDLTRPDSYLDALQGCQALFHVAADYRLWVKDPTEMHRVNIDGSRMLMESALLTKIKRIIYTSSVATLGIHKNGVPATEETPVTYADMIGTYKQSKFIAEQAVIRLIKQRGLPCVIVNPSTPIGPRDIKPTPTGRIIVEAAKGHMPAYVDTGLNIAHVDDVAEGHWQAFENGKIGEKYILGGENLDFGIILSIVTKEAGQRPPFFKIPRAPLYPFAHAAEFVARFTGKEPFATIDGLRMSKKKMFFSSAKAQEFLGYAPRSATAALLDAVHWFREHHYC